MFPPPEPLSGFGLDLPGVDDLINLDALDFMDLIELPDLLSVPDFGNPAKPLESIIGGVADIFRAFIRASQ